MQLPRPELIVRSITIDRDAGRRIEMRDREADRVVTLAYAQDEVVRKTQEAGGAIETERMSLPGVPLDALGSFPLTMLWIHEQAAGTGSATKEQLGLVTVAGSSCSLVAYRYPDGSRLTVFALPEDEEIRRHIGPLETYSYIRSDHGWVIGAYEVYRTVVKREVRS